MLNFLIKTANILDGVGAESAKKAADAIDGAIQAFAANEADARVFNDKLKGFLSDLDMIPHGWRHEIGRLREKQRKMERGLKPIVPTPVDFGGGSVPEPVKMAPPSPPDDASSGDPVQKNVEIPMKMKVIERDMEPEEVEAVKPSFKNFLHNILSEVDLIEALIKQADDLDVAGEVEAADILMGVVKEAAAEMPGLNETRKDLYDFKAHNSDNVYYQTKKEVDANSSKHHLETMQMPVVSQTRYSPELPGVMLQRLSDGLYMDPITHKQYNFLEGFADAAGNRLAGGSIANQTPSFSQYGIPGRLFEMSRKSR